MITLFADSFYYFALLNRRDASHEQALRYARRTDLHYVTTAAVMTEVADGLAVPPGRMHFIRLLEALLTQPDLTEIVPPSQSLFDAGTLLYRDRPDKEWSLTDCISFVVMNEQGLTQALTGDRHFEQAGYKALLASD